mgnify:CR=1 FL=1
MMARYGGGRPGSSRWVRLVPVRQSDLDHRAVARIVLALARQMAADEAVEPAADDAVSPGVGVCSRSERVASVGRCAAERLPSCRHEGAHRSPHEAAAASSMPGGTP